MIDSSEAPFASSRRDVRVVPMPVGAGIAEKRNRALFEASGRYVAWFDDDDWQHPERLTELTNLLEDGEGDLAGGTGAWFLDLWKNRCAPYRPVGELIFNSCLGRADLCKKIVFDERIRRASDTPWLSDVCREAGQKVVSIERRTYAFWLCHDTNVSNPRSVRRCVLPLSILRASVGDAVWGDTEHELDALRERLAMSSLD